MPPERALRMLKWKATTVQLIGWIGVVADLMPEVLAIRPRRLTQAYASVAVRISHELAEGVFHESKAGRGANAMRLSRHLYEQELTRHYIAERPGVRLDQLMANDARMRLRLADLNRGIRLTTKARKPLDEVIAAARAKPSTSGTPLDDRGFLPNYEEMAKALGRSGDDYDLFYRGASMLSHPGVFLAETYLEQSGAGRIVYRRSPDYRLTTEALALGLRSAVLVLDRANWSLGPVPRLSSRLETLMDFVVAGKDPAKVWPPSR